MMRAALLLRVAVHALVLAVLAASPLQAARAALEPVNGSGQPISTSVGRAEVVEFREPVGRIAVGDPKVLDYVVISPTQLYVLGKAVGSTNLVVWPKAGGRSRSLEVNVEVDLMPLRAALGRAFAEGQQIDVSAIGGSVVLSGSVSDVLVANQACEYADAFVRSLNRQLLLVLRGAEGGTSQSQPSAANANISQQMVSVGVINRLRIRDPQQVMLEVRVAEISKTLLKKLGNKLDGSGSIGDVRWSILSGFLAGGVGGAEKAAGVLGLANSHFGLDLDAEQRNGLIKILAEPTIVAVSGHEGSFLAGGVVFIPNPVVSGSSPTLTEYPFGISLKFTPTVLDSGRISLKVAPEVSEVSTESVNYTVGSNTLILPRINKRNVSTTVQLRNGQSLVIGGLLRNDVTQNIKRFPGLGDIPILGSLFRSSEFIADKSELVVIVSPSLVRATDAPPNSAAENYRSPDHKEFFLDGRQEPAPAQEKP